ncbi:MAG: Stk1 family PASTA domain-containing Ser/Thr kinase [Solirubrobacteraceae bacterium]
MSVPPPNTLIDGRYKVLARLGSGGMADVFLAEDQQLGRKVALKLLHGRFAADPDFVERFRREAQAAAGLQHPHVVSVYDRGSWDDTYYIAMEYLPGRTLKQLIREEAPLPPVRAIEITLQILKAARFAHRRGVIHRDLKPHNVIVDDSDQAKVTDFGIARAGASDMTETGSIMGTAQYLSPEQAQGHAVEAGSDLYSIGVVLYEMLTGRVPFDADAAVTIALKHVSEAPTPPRQTNPAIPAELEQVVLWVLNKNPGDRPADADQLIAALESVRATLLGGQGHHTASMAAIAPLVIPEPFPYPEPSTNGDFSEEPVAERRRWLPWLIAVLVLLLVAGAAVGAYLLTRPKQQVVPVVTGDQLNTARTIVQDAGFQVSVLNVPSPRASGTVIGESPTGGVKADKGSTVTLTVSQGPGTKAIPSVLGQSKAAATRLLEGSGLKVDSVSRASQSYPPGQATGTDPAAGTAVAPATHVTLFISSGKPAQQIPDVRGESSARASTDLSNAGFKVATSTQTSSSVKPGDVISQNPAGGSTATPGSTVSIVVATAPPTTAVPSVLGDTPAAATAALTAAGFTVTRQTKTVTNQAQDNIVLSQTPRAGAAAKKNSAVVIVIGKFTPTNSTTTPSSSTTTPGSSTTKSSTTPANGGAP